MDANFAANPPRRATLRGDQAIARASAIAPALAALSVFAAVSIPAARADVISTFDSGTDGWTLAPGSNGQLTHEPSGGNPGGFLKNDPTDGGDVAVIQAPPEFAGDLRQYDGGFLLFDATLLEQGGGEYFLFGVITLKSGSDARQFDVVSGPPPLNQWGSYIAPLEASLWGFADDPEGWHTFLSNITEMTIGAEAIFGPEINGFDNITLMRGPFFLELYGSCPGPMKALVTGATSRGNVALVRGLGSGNIRIPNNAPCAGTQLGLDASATLVGIIRADSGGALLVESNAPPAACGQILLQAVDLETCRTSNVKGL